MAQTLQYKKYYSFHKVVKFSWYLSFSREGPGSNVGIFLLYYLII